MSVKYVKRRNYYYCGDKDEVPADYCTFASRSRCVKKGFGSGMYNTMRKYGIEFDDNYDGDEMVVCRVGKDMPERKRGHKEEKEEKKEMKVERETRSVSRAFSKRSRSPKKSGKKIHTGARGGKYYLKNGRKVYV